MTVEEFIRTLKSVAELATHAGNEPIAAELEALALELVPFSDQIINAAVRAEVRASFGNEDLKMRFGRAFAFLRVFERSATNVGRAKDVKALQGMVSALEKPVAKRRERPLREFKPSDRARDFLKELGALQLNRSDFESLIARISDASLDLKDYNFLAAEYGRTAGKHRSKDAALTAVRDRFDGLIQRDRKNQEIDKLTTRRRRTPA